MTEYIAAAAVTSLVCEGLSLALELIPGFVGAWAKVSIRWKPLVFLGLCMLVAAGLPLLACIGFTLGVAAICPEPVDAGFVASTLAVGFTAWIAVNATFATVQDKLGKRIEAKVAVKEYLENQAKEVQG